MERGLIKSAVFNVSICCSTCGELLTMRDGCQLSDPVKQAVGNFRYQGNLAVAVEPCRKCMEKELGPARALAAAIAALQAPQ